VVPKLEPPSKSSNALDGCKELETALSAAVGASLPVPPAERHAFIAQHLLAQLEGRPLPVAEGAQPARPAAELKEELSALSNDLSKAVNVARNEPDWPIRAVATVLGGPAPPPPVPPQVQAVFDKLFDKDGCAPSRASCVLVECVSFRCPPCAPSAAPILPALAR
jgi:hypothetical protein